MALVARGADYRLPIPARPVARIAALDAVAGVPVVAVRSDLAAVRLPPATGWVGEGDHGAEEQREWDDGKDRAHGRDYTLAAVP